MEDTLISVIAIALAVILMFVFPLMTMSDRADDVAQLTVEVATTEFVNEIRTTGKITPDEYSKFIENIGSTGNTYNIEMEIRVLDENPGRITTRETHEIGENVYYSVYTSQIEEVLRRSTSDNIYKLKEGDTFTVTKLDRFARSLIDGAKLVQELLDRGIKINILNIGVMDNTPASKLIRNIFLSFAEFERDMILERTREGKEIARTKDGYKEGRPKKFTKEQIDLALSMLSVNCGDKSYNEVERLMGISVSTLKRENNKRKLDKINN